MFITKKTLSFYGALLLSSFLIFTACNKEADSGPSASVFGSGLYIANEGPFQNGTGTITWWNNENGQVKQSIFEEANSGEQLGNIVQSLYFVNSTALSDDLRQKIFIVVNNANKVVLADKDTFKKQGEIGGFELPRYLEVIAEGKALVTQWGNDGVSGSVAVVNLTTNKIEKTIPTGSGPESMLFAGTDKLYVPNAGGWGHDSTIAVVDMNAGSVTKTIIAGDNPVAIRPGKSGEFWVICRGHTEDFTNPDNPLNTKGRLVKIENDVVTLSLELQGAGTQLTMDTDQNQLFYLDNGQVYRFGLGDSQLETQPFANGFYYSIYFDPTTGTLIATDPKDYASNGNAIVFSRQGQIVRVIPVGIVPGNIWVRI